MSTATTWGVTTARRRRHGGFALLAIPVLVLAAAAAVAILAVTSTAKVSSDSVALARVGLPFGGGTIERLSVLAGRDQRLIHTHLTGGRIWPVTSLRPGERVSVTVVVRRPGWLSWLTGKTEQVRYSFLTPSSSLRSQYVTVRSGHDMKLRFSQPVRLVFYPNRQGQVTRHVLASPQAAFSLKPTGTAGTMPVAGAPRTWESPRPIPVSWFPPGSKATAVANPAPGSRIKPDSNITLTFSKPISQALGSHLPPVSPNTAGRWHQLDSHTITFEPTGGYGYGLGAKVSIPLPSGIQLVGGQARGSDPIGRWTVPAGSTARLQQILANLGYLPLSFQSSGTPVKATLAAEMKAAIHPPSGHFNWRYPNVPSQLRNEWSSGTAGVMTRGAVMAFETDQGMVADGVAGGQVWKALLQADLKGQRSTFGYTYVMVSEGSPETIHVWHDGHIVVSGPVNTGVAGAPTATGVFPVFEHLPVTTMTGTNPDGSHYSDPGIPWVSYFNGGDALHGFIRASYGFPQSDGCVEMPYSQAHQVYPYTPIGTLVNVA
ncbi:MAG TPA: L,D-transpeptidase family protein [Solirubrobacteraceae bacterium]|jgi:peptidoglycan hydrolase-like protein with peptidoglycan-binding domain|nr:L,D-transpeptidase family protein [Solirubrobacteraceae bacterium]